MTPYLFDASALTNRHLVVEREASSICAYPEICVGTKPVYGGHYIFNKSDRARFLQQRTFSLANYAPVCWRERIYQ